MDNSFKAHFVLMANYNTRMNQQVYQAAAKLPEDQLRQNMNAFFGSVLGTLNHIMIGDLLWLRRFQNHPSNFLELARIEDFPEFAGLDNVICEDFSALYQNRKNLDDIITTWINKDITAPDFSHFIEYTDTKGIKYKRNFAELLFHFFNHQTHHRGQLSTLLNQLGHDIGITDFLIDIPSE